MRIKDAFTWKNVAPYRKYGSGGIQDVRCFTGFPTHRRILTEKDYGEERVKEYHLDDKSRPTIQQNDIWCRQLLNEQSWVWVHTAPKEDLVYPSNSYVIRPKKPANPDVPPVLLVAMKEYIGGRWNTGSVIKKRLSVRQIMDTEIPEFISEETDIMEKVMVSVEEIRELKQKSLDLMGQMERAFLCHFAKGKSIKSGSRELA